jgi:hypothetical protein
MAEALGVATQFEQRPNYAFARSRNVSTPEGHGLGGSAAGGFISFANLRRQT